MFVLIYILVCFITISLVFSFCSTTCTSWGTNANVFYIPESTSKFQWSPPLVECWHSECLVWVFTSYAWVNFVHVCYRLIEKTINWCWVFENHPWEFECCKSLHARKKTKLNKRHLKLFGLKASFKHQP